jgi:small subunit ribosomal protein S6
VRTYEAVFVYPPGDAALATGKQVVAEEFGNQNVTVLGEEDMHERDLAYEIKGNERGHYVLYTVEAEPEVVGAIDKTLKIKPEILKFTFFREDPRLRQKRSS